MPYIFRVEDENFIGCYQGDKTICLEFCNKHDDYEQYPGPQHDEGIDRLPIADEICGFLSIKQLKDWFTKDELHLLKLHGYKIKRVEVIEITAIGKRQVLAIR